MSADKPAPSREAKLAQALRANLRRRKAPKAPQATAPEEGGRGRESKGG
jgi:hypothetical protein